MNRIINLIFILILFVFSFQSFANINVVTTIPDFADLAKQIGGNRISVSFLCKANQDPHFVDPRPSYVVDLNRADLLVYVGAELEIGWLPPLIRQARNSKIQPSQPGHLNASSVIKLMEVTGKANRAEGDVHPGGNPHYWYDPNNGLKVAAEILRRLKMLDPQGASYYTNNFSNFEKNIRSKINIWNEKLRPFHGIKVVTYHKSWVYFNNWASFSEAGYLEPVPGIPPSASHIAKLVTSLKNSGVKLVLSESYYPSSTGQLIAKRLGSNYLLIPSMVGARPEIHTYIQLIDAIVNDITNVLKRN